MTTTSLLVVARTPLSAVAEVERPDLILGSASPRRADLLARAGYTFGVETVEIDEPAARSNAADGDVVAATTAIARAKFAAFDGRGNERGPPPLLLTADTLVACQGTTMGKPESADALASMLAQMSGQQLLITTAVCLGVLGEPPRTTSVTTNVQLIDLEAAQIDRYVKADVGLDKAAGLALQSEARSFIAALDRCWSNVLGLPLCAVYGLLATDTDSGDPAPHCSATRCGSADAGLRA